MAIIATAGDSTTRTPAPEGTHQAVCVDVIDKGMLPNKFKNGALQHKIDIAWQIAELRDDGKRFVVYKRYTLSLNEKATLRHDLESWRGRKFTRDEEMGFDVETVKGVNCLINIQHNTQGDKTYANVMSVMALPKAMPRMAADGYVRATNGEQEADVSQQEPPVTLTDDDIPF